MKSIARYDKGEIRGKTEFTDEGFLKADAVVTRYGVFDYRNSDGTERKEFRPKDEVLKEDSIKTIKMIPITNNHPAERLVTSENAKRLSVGFTGETVTVDDRFVMTRLIITDQQTIDEIVNYGKKELSLGYTVDLIDEKGDFEGERYDFKQSNIRYNHLSIVNSARAGSEARINLDAQDAIEISNLEQEAEMAKRKIKIDEEDILVENAVANHIEKLIADFTNLEAEKFRIEEELRSISDKLEQALGEKDAAKEDLEMVKEEKESLESEKFDSSQINKMVRDRVKLITTAQSFLEKEVLERLDDLSDIDIKKKIITAKSPSAKLNGKSDVYITARFDAILEDISYSKVIAVGSNKKEQKTDSSISATDHRQKMIDDMKNAYKAGGK